MNDWLRQCLFAALVYAICGVAVSPFMIIADQAEPVRQGRRAEEAAREVGADAAPVRVTAVRLRGPAPPLPHATLTSIEKGPER